MDLGLFLELAEENKITYNQSPLNTLIEDMEKLKIGFFTNGCFSLGNKGEIDTNRFLQDSNELAKFNNKILDNCDDHPFVYTGNIYRYFGIFRQVNRSEHSKRANEFKNTGEYKSVNSYILNGNGCYLKNFSFIFKKDFSKECFEFI